MTKYYKRSEVRKAFIFDPKRRHANKLPPGMRVYPKETINFYAEGVRFFITTRMGYKVEVFPGDYLIDEGAGFTSPQPPEKFRREWAPVPKT